MRKRASKDAVGRIARQVLRAEREPQTSGAVPRRAPRGSNPSRLAVVLTAITGRSGTTLGKGTATLQQITLSSTGVATYSSLGIVVDVYNMLTLTTPATIAAGRLIQIKLIGNVYVLDVDGCS